MRKRLYIGAAVVVLVIAGTAVWLEAQTPVQVGYAVLAPDAGNARPSGSALFTFTNSTNVLVSEAGVGSAEATRMGRIFVDQVGRTRTGIALVNLSGEPARGVWILRDSSGAESERKPLALDAGQQMSRFVHELFENAPADFTGSLTFDSDRSLAAITLRQSRNAFGEELYTTLPVVNLDADTGSLPLVFPHIAAGGGYTTQLILVNPGAQAIRGRVNLIGSDSRDLLLRRQGIAITNFPYDIPAHGTDRVELESLSPVPEVGYAVVAPDTGSSPPSGSAIFQFRPGAGLVTEAGVGAMRSTKAVRVYVDHIGTKTGVAVVNPAELGADVTFTLMNRSGVVEDSVKQTLPARTHTARFVDELFPAVVEGYSGLMEIRASTPIVPITLKLTTANTRGELVLATLPVADLDLPPSSGSLVFPHLALGGGFSTRLILLNPSTENAANGLLKFYRQDGSGMELPMAGVTGNQFRSDMAAGGGRRFYPGNANKAATVLLVDPSTNQIATEIVVHEGNTAPLRLQVLDSQGAVRDDFDAGVESLDTEIATVNKTTRNVEGRKKGFSTLTITVGDVFKTATATVVKEDSGIQGYGTTGIAQDTARRLYLTSSENHSILRAESLKRSPELYAGISGSAGLNNDERLKSLFRNPAFLTLNHADASLYVSDSANNVIRKVGAGNAGRVETVAPTASFRNPQGVVLDGRGHLWVADSGNHTIRRINLVSGSVAIIAGQAGQAGSADGRGSEARFRSPGGIAIETETTAEQLERERVGGAPPPVRVIVADTGNGLIRRVTETGEVTTAGSVQALPQIGQSPKAAAAPAAVPAFKSPSAVAVDPAGNIYVTEPAEGRVRVILRSGEVVQAAQVGTLKNPRGVVIAENGKVVVAGQEARELAYGEPRIISATPGRLRNDGGQEVTVKGRNFSSDTLVVIGGVVLKDRIIIDSQTITFKAPVLLSGRATVTVQNRGGIGQASLDVDPVPLEALPIGYITTVAGGSTYAGEGRGALSAPINPWGIALDPNGNILVADWANNRVRRIDGRTGGITTVAGAGSPESGGDNGPAVAAGLNAPAGVAFDSAGNLLIAEAGAIRKVSASTGIITTLVRGTYGFCEDVDALRACLRRITGFTVDSKGNLFIRDYDSRRVLRVDAKTNIIRAVAGNGERGFSGDGGDGRAAAIDDGYGLAIDDARQILYLAAGNARVRQVDLVTNIITTAAGGGAPREGNGDNGLAVAAAIGAIGLALDAAGNLFIASGDRIRRVDVTTKIITTVAGGGNPADEVGDGGPATSATFGSYAVATDGGGNLFIGDVRNSLVRKVDAVTRDITSIAGNRTRSPLGDGGPAVSATLRSPNGVSIDAAGNLFITDSGNDRIRRVDAVTKKITTVAGGGSVSWTQGENRLATDLYFDWPSGIPHSKVAVDEAGNVYLIGVSRVSRIDAQTNRITRFIGNGQAGPSSGDGGQAMNAGMNPQDIVLDGRGNLYIAESGRVRKVNLSTRIITTVAGGGQPITGINYTGLATGAALGTAIRIAVDAAGNLFISDWDNGRLRKVDAATQIISTVAGGGASECGLNQLATSVTLAPVAVDVDAAGNLFLVDWCWPYGIRKVAAATRVITHVAGNYPALGDSGPATEAHLFYPTSVAVDKSGNVFIADTRNHRIRAIRGPIP